MCSSISLLNCLLFTYPWDKNSYSLQTLSEEEGISENLKKDL